MEAAIILLALGAFLTMTANRNTTATPGKGDIGGKPPNAQARGIRNKNPGNIRASRNVWRGQVGVDNGPGGPFAIFGDEVSGIRALAVLLKNYKRLHGIRTLQGLVSRYAPSSENDVSSYVASLARSTGIGPSVAIDLESVAILRQVIPAIIRHENGSQPYPVTTIHQGIDAA